MDWIELIQVGANIGTITEGLVAARGLIVMTLGGTRRAIQLASKKITGYWVAGDENDPVLNQAMTDIPILIQATPRQAFKDAENYVASLQRRNKRKVFAPLYVIGVGEDPTRGKRLNMEDEDEWLSFVNEFGEFIEEMQRIYGSMQFHLFMAAPAALCFGLGAIVGIQRKFIVYQYDPDAKDSEHLYMPVLTVSSKLVK